MQNIVVTGINPPSFDSNTQFVQKPQPFRKTNDNQKKNDYSQNFVNTGDRPQNFIRDIKPEERFVDYPKLNDLIKVKDDLIQKRNTPPMYIQADLKYFDLSQLGKFDVILMDPPWYEYEKRTQGFSHESEKTQSWTFDEISQLDIDSIADMPSFLFLWVGAEGLEDGRELFRKWGYKRCEDIVWVKTNKNKKNITKVQSDQNILQRVKEHCLVGLRGDVRRASDSFFINANIDTDVIVAEEPDFGGVEKPDEIYQIIERFCLGRKRLELFADTQSVRSGWLSIGKNFIDSNYDKELFESWFQGDQMYPQIQDFKGGRFLGTTLEIENLRPKSPRTMQAQNSTLIEDLQFKPIDPTMFQNFQYQAGQAPRKQIQLDIVQPLAQPILQNFTQSK